MENKALPYFYNHQLRSYILQFMQIFAWIQVETGKQEDGKPLRINVPVHYGLKDRVAASIIADNTTNSMLKAPSIAVYMTGVELAPERRKGHLNGPSQRVLPYGGQFPHDLKVAQAATPSPVNLRFQVSIMTTNSDDQFQILEQLMVLFQSYHVWIQRSDSPVDFTKLAYVEMQDIQPETTYPIGTDRRLLGLTINFIAQAHISSPVKLADNIIKHIHLRLAALDNIDVEPGVAVEDIDSRVHHDITIDALEMFNGAPRN